MRACVCGMPDLWGFSWAVWHRLHERQHLHAYPALDQRSRDNLRDLHKGAVR
jgi:hypothetical protein